MIMPIYAYGEQVLRHEAQEIGRNFPNLDKFIADLFETMYHTNGVGIAAPQVGISARLFIVDSREMYEEDGVVKPGGIKQVFINPEITMESGFEWEYEEGCLSIPTIREMVKRKPQIKIKYLNENFERCQDDFDGLTARVIQHEYDHLEGVLFTDLISPLRKQMIRNKLNDISKGQVKVDYKMKFPRR
jgi:peptide deformylase